jgi:hypothetical protein
MKTKLLSLGIMLMCLTGFQSAMFAQTVYVNSGTGNDGTGDGTSGNPYKTFNKGYNMVSVGGTIDLTGTFTWTDAGETGDATTSGYTIARNITIQGHSGQTIIQAATSASSAACRVFTVDGAYSVTFSNLEIRYGYLNDYNDGGGMYLASSASVTISNCYIHHNTARQGVGICIMTATVTITNSTIANNTGSTIQTGVNGGGICVQGTNPLTITNSTICNNSINGYGGGINSLSSAVTTLTNCTIVSNTSSDDGGGISIGSATATLRIKNTIDANNISTNVPASADLDMYDGILTDNGYNIVEVGTGTFTNTGDLTGNQVNLFGTGISNTPSLALNSSLNGTPTLALSAGSVAINTGSIVSNGSVAVSTTDQRGLNRVGAPDIGAYEYGAAAPIPTVTGISPTNGITAGGTSIIITGTNFTGATAVKFGSTNATGFTVNSNTQITAISPAGAAGSVDITVTTAGGTSATSASDQFTYVAAPTITGISSTSGPATGGTNVNITGTNFTGATAVKFGSTNATGFTVNSATQITATSPAGSAETVDVTVTTAGGTSATSAVDQYTYVSAPTITGISPANGQTAGGTSIIITGTGFTGATAVKFGSTNATGFTVNSATQITATSPAGAAGSVDITVTTAGGTSITNASDQFTYVAAPTITVISSTSGPTTGGTNVNITGTNFTGATAVKFGTANATGFTVNSATQITAISPVGTAGSVDITVTTAGGTSLTSASDQFTYVAAPTIMGISPISGPATGGTNVNITGTNFTGATAVKFGSTNATNFTVNSATQITATSPAGAAGSVDITVTTAGGTSITNASDQFTYVAAPTITGISPTSCPTAGGTSVVITGTGFTGATAVKFGATNATGFTVNSATQITATSPAVSAGTVDVTVTTAGGTSATSVSDQFTYVAAPIAISSAASNITNTGATLNGSVNANNASTDVTFEYGLTLSYGTTVTAVQSPVTGTAVTSVNTVLTGLMPNTTYHFRVVGINAGGTTNGLDQSFTTSLETGIDDASAGALILYPNPVTEGFTFRTGEIVTTVSIYDLSGRLVLSQQPNEKNYINISSLKQGIYLVKSNGHTSKLVKK